MSANEITNAPSLLRTTLGECRDLYVSSGQLCAQQYPHLISKSGEDFIELMDDLHRALVLKIYVAVCEADKKWSKAERELATVLFEHLWNQRLTGEKLNEAARQAAQQTDKLKWYSLVRPFDRIEPLRDRVGALETVVMRLANIIGRADGTLHDREAGVIQSIRDELQHHLLPLPIDEPTSHVAPEAASRQAIATMQKDADAMHAVTQRDEQLSSQGRKTTATQSPKIPKRDERPTLEEALAELDELVGLDSVKQEVRTLVNYLKLQKRRGEAGLSGTEVSLHMVFTGNPGTGKTTVARILGKVFGAMGILQKGHLVETDRSGLVAEYMGQTSSKAQAKINEALDGILFIDEAYSLVAKDGQDPYGNEAVQALLKRAEDDRHRLVVILAGYPDEMQTLLRANPGLSSRFNRVFEFGDYSPLEMARVFAFLCDKNRYKLAGGTRAKMMLGLTELHRRRDRHFGNGRTVRNLFEQAIRRMANRIADIRELTAEQLMLFEAEDVEFKELPKGLPLEATDDGPWRFRILCPTCGQTSKSRGSYLGQKVRCPKCEADFIAEWGEPESIDA